MNELKIFKQFAETMRMEFAIKRISVYKNNEKVYGETLDMATLEKYMSLSCTTVFRNTAYSILATQISVGKGVYIISLIADEQKAFDGKEADYIVSDIKKLKGKIGDTE